MKLISKLYLLLLLFVLMLFAGCKIKIIEPDNRLHISFNDPNFYGNWEYYNSQANDRIIDNVTIELGNNALFNTPIRLNERVIFNVRNNIHTPRLPNLDKDSYYASIEGQINNNLGYIRSNFTQSRNGYTYSWLDYPHYLGNYLYANTVNNITLEYNLINTSYFELSAIIDEQDQLSVLDFNDKLRNLFPDIIHRKISDNYPYNLEDDINYVIMAEGYRADQISFFREYATAAARNREYFSLNQEEWRNTNIFIYETISPEAFNLPFGADRKIQSYFEFNPEKGSINSNRMTQVVFNNFDETGLDTFNIDAYIIFVNTGNFVNSYKDSYLGNIIGYKDNKPIHFLIIFTQVDRSAGDLYYNHINKIGELLKQIKDD